MSTRLEGTPILVDSNNEIRALERVSLGVKEVSESWLQRRLFECPNLLPVSEIDPSFGPLIPIGCEIGTPAGPMDNLYISPQGTLTLVEAKLWRNPEARRQVVGQILDYAKELGRWSYDDLDERCKEVAGQSLWELVTTSTTALDIDEARFVDAVARNLRAGRFLLLIVGDGIREDMERLADFLQDSPQLRFTLALVELQIFRLDENYLILPLIVGRTKEIVRAVVKVSSSENASVSVEMEMSDGDGGASNSRSRRTLSEPEFFELLTDSALSDSEITAARRIYDHFSADDRFQIDLGAATYSLKIRDPIERSRFFTVIVVESAARAYVGWLGGQLERVDLPQNLAEVFIAATAGLLGVQVSPDDNTVWSSTAKLSIIAEHCDELITQIEQLADSIYRLRVAE